MIVYVRKTFKKMETVLTKQNAMIGYSYRNEKYLRNPNRRQK